jgi:hypothetical protein
MTHQEKLQKLFEAALKSQPEDFGAHPVKNRSVPASQTPGPETRIQTQEQSKSGPANREMEEKPLDVSTGASRTLNREESEELGVLLDDQVRRRRRRHRMEALVTALVLFGMTGGGLAWFVANPDRVQAFQEAMRDIRSVGDIKALVASYQVSLAKISSRSGQIDQSSISMGSNHARTTDEDPCMEAEMSEMMGGDGGQTVGARNKRLAEKFGDMASHSEVDSAGVTETVGGGGFEWER